MAAPDTVTLESATLLNEFHRERQGESPTTTLRDERTSEVLQAAADSTASLPILDFGWIVGNSETRVSTTLAGFLCAELALASPGSFGLTADQPE
jgi:hypothetical protein